MIKKKCLPICKSLDGRFAFKHYHSVSKIRSHNEVVLHNETSLLGVQNESKAHQKSQIEIKEISNNFADAVIR